jgi:hypothetical protein
MELPSRATNVDCWQRGEATKCESTTPNPNQSANTGRIPRDARASRKQLLLLDNLPLFKDASKRAARQRSARPATEAPAPRSNGAPRFGHERAPEVARSGNEGDQKPTRLRSVVAPLVPRPQSELPAFILRKGPWSMNPRRRLRMLLNDHLLRR